MLDLSHWLWWAIGLFGAGGTLLIVLAALGFWPLIIGTRPGRLALAAVTAGIGLIILYAKVRAEGAASERARQEKEDAAFLDQVGARDAADAELGDAELDRRLRDNRNAGPG